ncbi:MAG: SMP-30/gluconolactonase/LRE family protein [Rhodospirillaceae bacterium]|nr:SMP-30/gluconolactonase/LRE family protein [Rhodospirillaceae bacterium]
MARFGIPSGVIVAALLGLATTSAAADVRVINDNAGFPEGPTVLADGTLLYAEYGSHQVSRWDGKANSVLWSKEGCGPSAVVPMGENFAVTCYDSAQMVVISADGKTLATYDKDAAGNALTGANDATPDGKGGVFFTASGPWESGPIVSRVLHLDPDGTVTPLADDLHYANGIARSADGGLLYVNESEAGRVITFKIGADFSLSDRRLFVRLTGLGEPADAYPDGIKLGPDGHLYIGQYSSGRILVVDATGKLTRTIEVPSPAAPNMAFSSDGKTLYVTAVDDKNNAPYKGKVYALPLN